MLPANRQLLPVIGIDIHFVIILGAPVPVPHPFIGLVFDPMDWIPKIGATVKVNSMPRGNAGTDGMLGCKVHIPMGGPFAMAPTIGHDSKNFFGSPRVKAEGSYFSGAGFMVMTCNDIGMPLSITPGKKFKPIPSLYLPTSVTIPIPAGKPVIVGGPYVPDLMGMLMALAMSFGFGALMKVGGKLMKKALTALNHGVLKKFKCTAGLSKKFCKHGFEPVNLITGSVLYEGVDFELPGPIPIRWERNWYSDSGYSGLLGHGTHLSYDLILHVFEEDKAIGVILPDGRSTGFPLLVVAEENFYHRPEKITLTCKNKNRYEMYDHTARLTYSFERFYENVFKLVSIANLSGLAVKFYYDNEHHLEKIIDVAGRQILIDLDDFKRVIKVTAEHRGHRRQLIEYGYNEAGDLATITDAINQTTSIRYQNHLMVEKTDRNGQTFYWEYDGCITGARCIHTFGEGGILEGRIEYHKGFNVVTNSLGEIKTYYYDENGLCIQETDALGHHVYHEYTDFIELYRDIDEEGSLTGYVYDDRGYITAMQRPDGTLLHYMFDQSGNLQMLTNAEGDSTVYVYENNLLKAVVAADGSVMSYEYNDVGLIKLTRNNSGQESTISYDADYNLTEIKFPSNAKASWKYDEWGRCLTVNNPENQSQNFRYDLLSRVTQIKKYDGSFVKLRYNAYDEVVYAEDAYHRVNFEYTPLGSLKVREENGSRVQFNYNTEERLISLRNEQNEIYQYKYDKCGRIVKEVGFDGLTRNYNRDRAGKVIKVNRPGNKYTEYEYDLAGRLIRSEYSDGSWETFSYNKNGQFIEAFNQNSRTTIQRDLLSRIIGEDQDGYSVKSQYNNLGKRSKVSSNLGACINFTRNDAGYVSRTVASNNEGGQWDASFEYNTLGFETKRLVPGGVTSSFKYDRAGHPVDHTIQRGSRSLRHRIYSWNVNDRLQSMINGLTKGIVQFGYDEVCNLAWARYEDKQYDYRMPDNVGNLFQTKERTDRKYGTGGKLLECLGTKYDYDEEGNLVSKVSPEGKKCLYEWADNGMLKKVILPDKQEVLFEYDALRRRTAKISGNLITRWVWDGNLPLHEWKYPKNERPKVVVNEFGEITKDKDEPVDGLISWLFDEGTFKPAAKLQGSKMQSIITDYHGTPVEMLDEDGTQTWSTEYNILGKIRKQNIGRGMDCPFRYQGQYEDEETGLYYNRFRYYDPKDGLYISQDPIKLRGNNPNIYAYTHDPNSWLDVFGLAHSLLGEIVRDDETIFSQPYESGGVFTGQGSPNQQEALTTHTERKFLNDAVDTVEPGDHIKMTGELNPCKPGCQPAIRDFVMNNDVTAEYHATTTGTTYHWEKVSDTHLIQTETVNGKATKYSYNMEARRRVKICD